MAKVNLNQTDNNKTTQVRVGDTITITLYETPTGYTWELSSFSSGALSFEGVTRNPSPQAASQPLGSAGGGGQSVDWEFKAKAPGRGSVSLTYSRGNPSDPTAFKYQTHLDISA
jgi:predicted secreted protein